MTATVASATDAADPRESLRQELSQLHILLLGARADAEDIAGPVPSRQSAASLHGLIKQAVQRLDSIRARVEAG